jgi:hypothetical protein
MSRANKVFAQKAIKIWTNSLNMKNEKKSGQIDGILIRKSYPGEVFLSSDPEKIFSNQ